MNYIRIKLEKILFNNVTFNITLRYNHDRYNHDFHNNIKPYDKIQFMYFSFCIIYTF